MKSIRMPALVMTMGLVFPSLLMAKENVFIMGPRAMAMGGAYVGVAEDDNARYWNPGAVAVLPTWYTEGRADVMITKDTSDLAEKSEELTEIMDDIDDEDKRTDALGDLESEFLTPLSNSVIGANVGPTGGLSIPRVGPIAVGVGGFLDGEATLYLERNQTINLGMPSLEVLDDYIIYDIRLDKVYMLTTGYNIKELIPAGKHGNRNLSVGVNFKQLERWRYSDRDDKQTILDLKNNGIPYSDMDSLPNATAIGFDVGLHSSVTDWLNAGFVFQDIGMDLSYTKPLDQDGNPIIQADESIPTNIRLGAAMKPLAFFDKESKYFDFTITADLDNIDGGVREDSDFTDKTHIGMEGEFSIWNDFLSIALRTGANQGFTTYGAKLKGLWAFEVDYTFYGDELADYQMISVGINF